jgi:hypothetical protein
MLNSSVRRVALACVSFAITLGVVVTTGGCGARPTASVGQPVIVPPLTLSVDSGVPETTAAPTTPPAAGAPVDPAPPAIDPKSVQEAAFAVEPNTTLGAVVHDRATGQELLSVNADRQFRSASLVKLLIAIDTLQQGADESTRQQIARMLAMSDDGIASALWVRGGPGLVARVSALIGLVGTEAPEVAGQWGEVKLTAHDVVRVYQYVMDSMSPADHTLIVDALAQAPQIAADGFDQYFGIPDGLNTQRAIKQGWGNNSSAMVLHSTGLVGANWRYVVVLLSEHVLGSGWRTSANSVTAAAGALNGLLPGV